jgi:hypothetical protein
MSLFMACCSPPRFAQEMEWRQRARVPRGARMAM